jgi:acetyl esterase
LGVRWRSNLRRVTLDTNVQMILDLVNPLFGSAHLMTATELRAALAESPPSPFPPVEMASVSDMTLPSGSWVRVYRPTAESVANPADSPTMLWIHGGGFVIGDVEGNDLTVRKIAAYTGCTVASIEYRLAPEYPFPAAPDDVFEAIQWITGGGLGAAPSKLLIGGDSAGANLAMVGALRARNAGIDIAHQLLVYPCVDPTCSTESYKANAEGYLLSANFMHWFWNHYLGADYASNTDPHVNPLQADSLAGMASATVITAGYDPLCDEGKQVAAALQAAGVTTDTLHCPGLIHGFIGFGDIIPTAEAALKEMCEMAAAAIAP